MQDRYRFFLSVALVCLAVPAVGSEITFIHPDHLDSPVAYTDINGNTIGREYYTPYGEPLNAPGNDGINFTGHVRDSDTGLLYMQARYYDPQIGRFLSVDPVTFSPVKPDYFNRYWYAGGNPIKNTDPDGRCFGPLLVPCIVIGPAATADAVFVVGSALVAAVLIEDAVNHAMNESADSTSDAVDKLTDGATPARGESGKKGEMEGAGGSDGAQEAWDNIAGEEKTYENGTKVKTLSDGGTAEMHGSTKSPDYDKGTPTIKVQNPEKEVVTTVRYPEVNK